MISTAPRIDHVVITVGDGLDAARNCFERLGFLLTARGHHTLGSSNHLAIFGTDYLELLGFEPGRVVTRADLATLPLGLTGLVFKTDDAMAVHEALVAENLPVDAPKSFSRPVTTSDGVGDARFRTVSIAPGVVPNGRTFFCEHFTPDLVWRDEWRLHDNGAFGIAEFVISTKNPERGSSLWASMFGRERITPVAGGLALPAGDAAVLFLTPDAVSARFGGAVGEPRDDADRMVALTLRTRAPGDARGLLIQRGVPFVDLSDRIVVPADFAMGVAIAFSS